MPPGQQPQYPQLDRDDYEVVSGFAGYQNNSDITIVPPNFLVPPSQNVLITGDTVKCIETRAGYKLLGRSRTQVGRGIRSKYDDFINANGIKLPIREYQDLTFNDSHIEVFYNGDWQPIYGNTNFPHEMYFAEWADPTTAVPAVIMVGGNQNIDYWTGGISLVTAFTTNSITLQDPIAPLGFTAAGTMYVGASSFSYTSFTGNTFNGVTPDPTGVPIIVGQVATQPIVTFNLLNLGQQLSTPTTIDVVTDLENHIYYGSYGTRNIYISNQFATTDLEEVTDSSTNLDDLLVTGTYFDTTVNTVKIQITTTVPTPVTSSTVSSSGIDDVNFSGEAIGNGAAVIQVVIDGAAPDTFSWLLNGFTQGTAIPCTAIPTVLGTTGISVSFSHGDTGHVVGDSYVLYVGRQGDLLHGNTELYTWYLLDTSGNFDVQGAGIPITTPLVYNGVTFSWQSASIGTPYGHALGDFWEIFLQPAVVYPYVDVYFSTPIRRPGQGWIQPIDSPPVELINQEQSVYVNAGSGDWGTFNTQLSSDLTSETITYSRLKSEFSNKAQRQCLSVNTKNYIGYMNVENQLLNLGRVMDILSTPMTTALSLPVRNDFLNLQFIVSVDGNGNGWTTYGDNKLFVTIPSAGLWYIYDDFYGFWNPPQTGYFTAISVINGQICAHSSISDETYVLFSASNDNGFPFTSVAAFAYNSDGRAPFGYSMVVSYDDNTRRDRLKEVSKFFIEAYKTPNTNMYGKLNLEWGNAKNGPDVLLEPIVYTPQDTASLGHANLGHHGLANDPVQQLTKFHYFVPFDREFVYENQLVFYCSDIDNYFKIVSAGVNSIIADQRNVVATQSTNEPITPQGDGVPGTPPPTNTSGGGNVGSPVPGNPPSA